MRRCPDCCFWYVDPEDDDICPTCHYTGPDAWAPCAQDEDEMEEEANREYVWEEDLE